MKVIVPRSIAQRSATSIQHSMTQRGAAEARALIAELLGRQVRIWQDGAAVFARLEIDEAVLLASAEKSLEINDFQVGSGGALWSLSIGVFCFSDKDSCAIEGPAIPLACGNGHPLSAFDYRGGFSTQESPDR